MRQTPTLKEVYALELINMCFEQFGNLQLSDKPDILSDDKQFGIEVTSGFSENDEIANSFRQYLDSNIRIERKRQIRNWLSTYFKYRDSLPSAYKDYGYLQLLNQRINNKREKIAGYQKTEKLGLFITTEICQDLRKSLYRYIDIYQQHADIFDFLILDVNNWSYVIYINSATTQIINYSDRKQEINAIAEIKYQEYKRGIK